MPRLRPAGVFAAALLAALIAGCGPSQTKAAPIEITLADYAITAPATIPAGVATFVAHDTGTQVHQAGLARLDSGKTVADFTAAMQQQGAPPPRWIVWMGGLQDQSETAIPLDPGNYVWFCLVPDSTGMPHLFKGMVAPMSVTASTGAPGAAPEADIDLTIRDYQWDFSRPLTPGKHVVKVTVAPGQPHEWVLVRFKQGATPQDVLTWAAKPSGKLQGADYVGGIPMLQSGETNYAILDLQPGHYMYICFVPDATDGKPHFVHGMMQDLVIQ